MGSIRKTLIVGTAGAMIVLLVASGVFLFLTVRTSLFQQFDRALWDKAAVLSASVEVKSERVIFDDEDLEMDEFHSPEGPGYLQVWADNGQSIYRSPSLADGSFELQGGDKKGMSEKSQVSTIRLPNGRRGRAVRNWYPPRVDDEDPTGPGEQGPVYGGGNVELVFARDTAPVMDTLRRLELILIAFGIGTIVLSSALLHAVIHRALKPLDTLAAEIGAVRPEGLFATIALNHCPEELEPVVERLNDLFARLKSAFDRERAFSADVAHELRTPLAGIRSTLEVTLARPRATPEYESALRACLEVAGDMQEMVENLLTLARLDSGEFEIVREDINLCSILDAAFGPLRAGFAARNVKIQWDVDKGLTFESDASLLQIVARNLLDNALSYTDEGGWVKVSAHRIGANAVVRVSNSGSKIAAGQLNHVFDRFWRDDAARSETGTHCGLGLSLVKKIVTTLGGTAEVESSEDGVFGIAITIPKMLGRA